MKVEVFADADAVGRVNRDHAQILADRAAASDYGDSSKE
jgi:hypothetical protein